jgi:predicted transcriptional regulator
MDQSTEIVDKRAMLLRRIEENPGIRYRELLRTTGLVNGVLSYHLYALEKSDVIKVDRQPRTTRYYSVRVSDKEYNILKFVRHKSVRKIILFLVERELRTFNELLTICKRLPLPYPSNSDA